ncbi:putative efflux protein, MATE family [Tissierella praeacuta DSM 18095]|uniref:Probable multidrug resistance protein NorM n=1 Tax=Tissierella praeacuta DSM 18095 TaxID=1123404 RepID=A0A1M4W0Y4_9FIRM|nr:MATE family efflux transporter [Tissierella praeacuta]TCU75681.1 putative MATE family efflux protein [Tissierella praeacuta]SHE74921.1 putative efflux protein, MATE family [Tissierella praeacuta DSM 18095]SUP00222.1 Multidrug export protein mepA [Tissierella praeacuta]
MSRNINLIEGNISSTLTKLALPIMGTSFIQMMYNLTDMMWLGRLSTKAVAGAGTVGFFMWFGMSLVLISQIGVSVGVSQSYGKGEMDSAREYISSGIKLDIIIGIIYSSLLLIFRHQVIGFFNLNDTETIQLAIDYLVIIAFGFLFHFINPIYSAIFNASGNSITPFIINTMGLITNIILDPILIFGVGPFPKLGIKGAAVATIVAQIVVTSIYILVSRKNKELFSHLHLFKLPKLDYLKRILKLGFPAFLQSGVHASISMVLTKILAKWGSTPVAVQSVGSQIESISWMTAEGFSTAISAFVGQNYGAENYDRVKEGYYAGLKIVGTIGIFATVLLIFFGEPIFRIFTPNDAIAISQGVVYLKILGLSQFFITIEIASAGAFNGIGRTQIPAIIGIILNALRIPGALILSSTVLGMTGVWWSMSISTVFKGIILTSLFIYVLRKGLHTK